MFYVGSIVTPSRPVVFVGREGHPTIVPGDELIVVAVDVRKPFASAIPFRTFWCEFLDGRSIDSSFEIRDLKPLI